MDADILKINLVRMTKLSVRLQDAQVALQNNMPLDVKIFDPDSKENNFPLQLDGFRVRFADLQDILGQVIFPMVCQYDEDETAQHPLSTRERIVLMEKKDLISTEKWKLLSEIRNRFMHEYPDEHEEKALLLNQAWGNVDTLIQMVNNINKYLENT